MHFISYTAAEMPLMTGMQGVEDSRECPNA